MFWIKHQKATWFHSKNIHARYSVDFKHVWSNATHKFCVDINTAPVPWCTTRFLKRQDQTLKKLSETLCESEMLFVVDICSGVNDSLTTWLFARHLKLKHCPKTPVYCTSSNWLRGVSDWLTTTLFVRHLKLKHCPTTPVYCTSSTSQVPKTPKTVGCWRVLCILTSKSTFRDSGAQFYRIRCLKSAPILPCFVHFHFKMCLSPQARAFFQHQHVQKCSRNEVFCTFSLPNVPFATAACIFSTSARTKVVQTRHVLCILTSKCAFRHSGVQFFDIRTTKSGLGMRCSVHFHFQMCLSPQARAFFQHQHVQKWSKHVMFCAFWLQNVRFATVAYNFATSALRKVLWGLQFFHICTSECAFRHSGVQFLI